MNGRKVRVIPVDASCSERHNTLDPPFVDQAAKELEEPKVHDAALCTNGRFDVSRQKNCEASYQNANFTTRPTADTAMWRYAKESDRQVSDVGLSWRWRG